MEEIDNVKLMCDDMMSSLMEEVASTSDLNIICADGKYCCNKICSEHCFLRLDHCRNIMIIKMISYPSLCLISAG